MDFLKKYFPYSFRARDAKSFVITLLIYVLIGIVAGFLIRILAHIPVVSLMYVLVGVVLAVLYFVKVIE